MSAPSDLFQLDPKWHSLALGVELAFVAAGLLLAAWYQLRPLAKGQPTPIRLDLKTTPGLLFFQVVMLAIGTAFSVQFIAGSVLSGLGIDLTNTDSLPALLAMGLAFQGGMLAGGIAGGLWQRKFDTPAFPAPLPQISVAKVPLAGLATMLAGLAVVVVLSYAWQWFLQLTGREPEPQDFARMFDPDTPWSLKMPALFLAVVIAPLSEEILFRGGLFGFLRAKVPRPHAIALSAVLFSLLHLDVTAFLPLCGLGLVFSIAYERTGRLSVTILAHALFNLHTVVTMLLGLNI